jgi:hypothetical protein
MNGEENKETEKSMIELDGQAKIQLNEIKSYYLKLKAKEPNLSQKTSYRAITKTAIDELHKKLIQNV